MSDLSQEKVRKANLKILKVFISYSRTGTDRAVAGLLANALRGLGIEPLYDEGLYAGANLGEQVSDHIREADVFLLLLTNRSEASLWVNQEIGFAKALYKPIIPVLMDESVEVGGMLRGMRLFECSNWFSSKFSTKRLKADIEEAINQQAELPPIVIPSEMKRTEVMIECLNGVYEQLEKDKNLRLRLYEQSALSIFSVDGETPSSYDSRYWALLCEQRTAMEKLIHHERVETRLHMWPFTRKYDVNAMRQRTRIVHEWLTSDHPETLKVCIGEHNGPNTLAVEDQFAFEGLRTSSSGEYTYTLHWRHPSLKIKMCFSNFNSDSSWMPPSEAAKRLGEITNK